MTGFSTPPGALTLGPYWPCESNSVCLGSSPRALGASVACGLSAGVLASRASPTSVLPYLASPRRPRCASPAIRVPNDQTASRSAFAAACRRSLTSASSRAARSMRSCCICARSCWLSTRSCWLSARVCWRSARSVIALRSFAIASTVLVSSANCEATLAMSSRVVTFAGFYAASGASSRLGLLSALELRQTRRHLRHVPQARRTFSQIAHEPPPRRRLGLR